MSQLDMAFLSDNVPYHYGFNSCDINAGTSVNSLMVLFLRRTVSAQLNLTEDIYTQTWGIVPVSLLGHFHCPICLQTRK